MTIFEILWKNYQQYLEIFEEKSEKGKLKKTKNLQKEKFHK